MWQVDQRSLSQRYAGRLPLLAWRCGSRSLVQRVGAFAALGKKFHPEHFVCSFCMNVLAGGKFSEKNGKAYCGECHGKLFKS